MLLGGDYVCSACLNAALVKEGLAGRAIELSGAWNSGDHSEADAAGWGKDKRVWVKMVLRWEVDGAEGLKVFEVLKQKAVGEEAGVVPLAGAAAHRTANVGTRALTLPTPLEERRGGGRGGEGRGGEERGGEERRGEERGGERRVNISQGAGGAQSVIIILVCII